MTLVFHPILFHFAEEEDLTKFIYRKVVYKMRDHPHPGHGYFIDNYLFIKSPRRGGRYRPENTSCKVVCQQTRSQNYKNCQVAGFIDKTSNRAILGRDDMVHTHPPPMLPVDCSNKESEISTVSNGEYSQTAGHTILLHFVVNTKIQWSCSDLNFDRISS